MTDITIHHISLSYDEAHERVRNFVKYLSDSKRKEELKSYCQEAKHSADRKIHLNDTQENEFTLEYRGNSNYSLRLRGT